ncbi:MULTISPECIES: hypothetical protein [unclassified Leucobacter]|uniref:hypothetical protein n=1 Tax=unclassified Leucobacter TaxID=2621730 RepID=UPI00165D7CC2|nr:MULTISPECIES: hypothetical protein [unclassified Leucobacter]MBC9927853.1 hypothetical protein [Leucobacter sp. cx-169]
MNSDPVAREQSGRDKIEAAYAAAGGAELITEGEWAGFAKADAIAWCWNLYQYEPHGFVHPANEIRYRREQELESGGIPEGGGYPAKARQYISRGVTPQQYREAREVLGSRTISWR